MNEQVRSILAQETTKTSKIRQLYLLGVPRAEIARMVTNGNYGFVVNALRRMREREDGLSIHPSGDNDVGLYFQPQVRYRDRGLQLLP